MATTTPHTNYTKLHDLDDDDHQSLKKTKDGDLFVHKQTNHSLQLARPNWLRWCWYITLSIVVIFLTTSLVVGTCGYFWMKRQVIRFTVTTPVAFPVVQVPPEELDVARDRVMLFVDTLRAGSIPQDDLIITTRELNGLIATSDYLRGNARVSMTEDSDKVTLDMSLPAKYLPGGTGRFFVATSYVAIDSKKSLVTTMLDTQDPVEGLDDDILFAEFLVTTTTQDQPQEGEVNAVYLESGEIMGVSLDSIVQEHQNLLEYVTDCPDAQKILHGIAAVVIQDDQIVIKARSGGTEE